jgi:hypothetical protein
MVDEARPSAACDASFRSEIGFDEHPLIMPPVVRSTAR